MRPLRSLRPRHVAFALALLPAALTCLPAGAFAQLKRTAPASLTDAEFWTLFTSMSEPGGSFASENFVSNEMTYQYVIPTLQRTVAKDGVYLGVGPEQNFTYIANLKPRLAIIFDIRRQNAMAHLMYKALFELSPTRSEFVSRLFSRPLTGRVAPTAKVSDMFAVATAASRSDSAYEANERAIFRTLVDTHHFTLTPGDSAAIEHLFEVFYDGGPDIDYAYRLGRRGFSTYPSYGTIQTQTNADNVPMAFLSSEENYQAVRAMHQANLIVPVVGDFAGPKAIRGVGEYLRQRSLKVSAFYLSNVEQYLFQNGVADKFYENVATLPLDSSSTFIRSVPLGGGGGGGIVFNNQRSAFAVGTVNGSISIAGSQVTFGGSNFSVSTIDTGGVRQIRISQDTAGQVVTRTYRDSAGMLVLQSTETRLSRPGVGGVQDTLLMNRLQAIANRQDSIAGNVSVRALQSGPPGYAFARPMTIAGSSLTSGIANIGRTLNEFRAGTIFTYRDIIALTKVDGWK
jgi:hypothetical protein